MKIIELRFKNLNSLYGEWMIDFGHDEYSSNGIFALTGPTGAGKSTILDAVCLALYGATPRLGKITKSANEIMSRRTGECFAELVFETREGRFRCHWSQRRARKKPDGALQAPRHELSLDDGGRSVIESKLRKVSAAIEEKTGMDFDRFTRSILLAQGGFDTFLKADSEKKSMILEQITGTGIYSRISCRVHERLRREQAALELLSAETSGIELLDTDKEAELRDTLTNSLDQVGRLRKELTTANEAIAWLGALESLEKEIDSLAGEEKQLLQMAESFKPHRKRLALAIRAAAHESDYVALSELRKQCEEDNRSLNLLLRDLPGQEAVYNRIKEEAVAAGLALDEARRRLKEANPVLIEVRLLDKQLEDRRKRIDMAVAELENTGTDIEKNEELVGQCAENREQVRAEIREIFEYIEKNSEDEALVRGLAGLRERLLSLISVRKELGTIDSEALQADRELNERTSVWKEQVDRCESVRAELVRLQNALEKAGDDLSNLLDGRLLREYRAEKEALLREAALIAKITDLEEYRHNLEDGNPCPLCGSCDHPYARGNVPEKDEIESKIEKLGNVIRRIEDCENIMRRLEKKEKDCALKLAEARKNKAEAGNRKKMAEKQLREVRTRQKRERKSYEESKKSVLRQLKPFDVNAIPDDDIHSLLESLERRLENWLLNSKKKIEAEKKLSDIEIELGRLAAVVKTKREMLREKRRSLDSEKRRYAKLLERRTCLYGDKEPESEEAALNLAIDKAESNERLLRAECDRKRGELEKTRTRIDTLRKRLNEVGRKIEAVSENFFTKIKKAGFTDEKDFLSAVLSLPEREKLEQRQKNIDDELTRLRAKKIDRIERLEKERSRKVTEADHGELLAVSKDLEERVKQLNESVAAVRHRLRTNTGTREKLEGKMREIDAQVKECDRWRRLHELIGSADGKKFRNFAQGLTFELLVAHANRQLRKMSDRYLLVRKDRAPLELNVIDNYQAGEIRSSRNLSGGESFIVSLSLALGLSRMASRNVTVDSLFLDEGFGTLDEQSLETALEALAGLQQEGKLIGVISHVTALKERIPIQIRVMPGRGGKSLLSGPGCRKVAGGL